VKAKSARILCSNAADRFTVSLQTTGDPSVLLCLMHYRQPCCAALHAALVALHFRMSSAVQYLAEIAAVRHHHCNTVQGPSPSPGDVRRGMTLNKAPIASLHNNDTTVEIQAKRTGNTLLLRLNVSCAEVAFSLLRTAHAAFPGCC